MVNPLAHCLNFKKERKMASSYYKLDVTERKETRSKAAKALRKKGMIPGVL